MPKPFNLFISYAHKDTALQRELDEHLMALKDAKIINIWTDSDIMPGTEWEKQILDNLENAQIILLLVSASFLASPFCRGVWLRMVLERHKTNTARVIPIILRPAFWKVAPFGDLQALPRSSNGQPLAVTSWSQRDDAWTNVAQAIYATADELEQEEKAINPILPGSSEVAGTHPVDRAQVLSLLWKTLRSRFLGRIAQQVRMGRDFMSRCLILVSSALGGRSMKDPAGESFWNIPYVHNRFFTGQKELLRQLAETLKMGQPTALSQPQAISGLGGIGKTQIAVEYAYQHQRDYQAVFWVRADTREALVSGYVALASLLNLPEKDEKDQTIVVEAVLRWLQTHGGWLLILDNADELADVCEFLPPVFGGHILLTTRAQATGKLANCIEVDTMPQEVGALFLLRRAKLIAFGDSLEDAVPADVATAREICEELGGLPLALDQAGAYIEATQCNLSDYQSLYRTRRSEMLNVRGGFFDDHPKPVATTWSLSFQKVEQKKPAAADLLRFCAFLHPDAIPEELLTIGEEHLGPELQRLASDPLSLNEAVAALGAYSLIIRNPQEKTLSVHRLVQAVQQDKMDEESRKQWAERTVRAVNMALVHVEYQPWPQRDRLLPHALHCAELIQEHQLTFFEAVRLLNRTARYLREYGRYEEAEPLYLLALQICEQALGEKP